MFHITYGQYNHNIYTPHIKTTDIATHAAMFTISRGTYCTISMVMKCRYCALVDIVEPTRAAVCVCENPTHFFFSVVMVVEGGRGAVES